MNPPILQRVTRWVCPNCDQTDVTNDPRPHSRMHICPGLAYMTAPMVEEGIHCKVEANERQDFVGNEIVTTDASGRPVMNITTTRDDGTDCVVFAPCATRGVATWQP